jgi:hypothetical protein
MPVTSAAQIKKSRRCARRRICRRRFARRARQARRLTRSRLRSAGSTTPRDSARPTAGRSARPAVSNTLTQIARHVGDREEANL